MKKYQIIIVSIVILVILTFFLFIKEQPSVFIKSKGFNVELADSSKELQKGLMYRKSLGKNNGMLFIFPEKGYYNFWMKNTLIPLDIIWINENKIVFISEKNQPCNSTNCSEIVPNAQSDYVLEINSGLVEKYNLKIGDDVYFHLV